MYVHLFVFFHSKSLSEDKKMEDFWGVSIYWTTKLALFLNGSGHVMATCYSELCEEGEVEI